MLALLKNDVCSTFVFFSFFHVARTVWPVLDDTARSVPFSIVEVGATTSDENGKSVVLIPCNMHV